MRLLLLAAMLALPGAAAHAQSAARPTRIIVPFAAGGASDTYTRIAAQKITEQSGKAFVVESRTGAGGRIAWEAAAKSAPDGATMALIDATYPMPPGLFAKLPWDVASDLVPAAMIVQTPFVIIVGAEPSNFTPEEFARFLREDTRRWTDVIRTSGIRIEQ